MRRGVNRIWAVMLCAAVLLGLRVPASGSASSIYLMAVNDKVVEMTAENMPMVVGGGLYVPYTILSSRITGINLGVSAQYSTTRRTVLVSGENRGVTFDPQANSAYDLQNNPLDVRAVVRNTMVYLPLAWVCNYFGTITYSLTRTPYGTLVRVTNSSVVLSDAVFVDAADSLLADNFRRYQASTSSGEPMVQPSSPIQSPPLKDGPLVYLAFRWGEQTEEIARQLEDRGQRALFLFRTEELASQDGLVRRLIAAGHTVGLTLLGRTWPDCLAEAEDGNRLLADIARYAALVVQADGLDHAGRSNLALAGYVLFTPTHLGEDYSSANALIRGLNDDQTNYVEMTCTEDGLALAQNSLGAFARAGCRLRQATAPTLAEAVTS